MNLGSARRQAHGAQFDNFTNPSFPNKSGKIEFYNEGLAPFGCAMVNYVPTIVNDERLRKTLLPYETTRDCALDAEKGIEWACFGCTKASNPGTSAINESRKHALLTSVV